MRVRALAAAAAVGLIIPVSVATTASATTAVADVTIVHGIAIAGLATVDVYVDDELLLDDFTFGGIEIAPLPAGTYAVDVAPGTSTSSADAVLSDDFEVGTADVTIAAQVDAAGAPVLVAYPDDFSEPPAGQVRLFVRHAAQAGAVSVESSGAVLIPSITNGEALAPLVVPAGSYAVDVKAGGAVVPGLTSAGAKFTLRAGYTYVIYAVGGGTAPYSFIIDTDDELPIAVVPAPTATPSTTASTTTAPAVTTTRPAIPTAVPAGDGSSGWAGPLGVPALLAIALAAGLALAVGFGVRGNASHRR